MAVSQSEEHQVVVHLPDDFTERLETSLRAADRERARHRISTRLGRLVPILLLVGPLVAWHLIRTSPDGVHVVVDSLAWVAFLLDVGVHLDSAVLQSLNLEIVPSLVGIALAITLGIQMLWYTRKDE